MKIQVGDILKMKKQHPCGSSEFLGVGCCGSARIFANNARERVPYFSSAA